MCAVYYGQTFTEWFERPLRIQKVMSSILGHVL